MNIDKNKLKLGIWYEDRNGNVYAVKPKGVRELSYHVCFPVQVTEKIMGVYDNKKTCKHPLKQRKRTTGWVKGIKGCVCKACGKTKTGKSYIPFALMKWDTGSDTFPLLETHHTLSKDSQKCVVAMVNSGDFELDEAILVMATACERCMNVLIHKYLGDDGYEEYSEEWKKANTVCEFCEGMDNKEIKR